jgi:hypothetical protein
MGARIGNARLMDKVIPKLVVITNLGGFNAQWMRASAELTLSDSRLPQSDQRLYLYRRPHRVLCYASFLTVIPTDYNANHTLLLVW